MRYTILTPTLLRPSLLRACESVNSQTCTSWSHIVIVDSEISDDTIAKIAHPQRTIVRCEQPHNDWVLAPIRLGRWLRAITSSAWTTTTIFQMRTFSKT